MHDVTNNFALAVRLYALHVSMPNLFINLYRGKRGRSTFEAGFIVGGTSTTQGYKDEREAFAHFKSEANWVLDAARTSQDLYYRGLARRAELMNSLSEAQFEALVTDFEKVPVLMWETALAHFGGKFLGKHRLKPRITATTKGLSWWEIRGKVSLPHYPAQETLVVRFFPSPVDDATWSMQVSLPGIDADVIRRNQQVTRDAMDGLRARGMKLEDVTNGTLLVL